MSATPNVVDPARRDDVFVAFSQLLGLGSDGLEPARAVNTNRSLTVPETEAGPGIDCAVICTNHTVFDYASMPKRFPLVVDTRNALKGASSDRIFRL